ncbi:hypothetical protein ACLQ2Q_11165 [Microbacterium sp. DT81.1]|uniref:hypothetical protein n=1 Tax=Microbacterium sp. DT81.1 TaxID=3393413 RepID=UPI003CEA6885
MSTPEQPGEPQLTRKQLREIRMTGATPIIGPDTVIPGTAKAPVEQPVKTMEREPAESEPVESPPAESERVDSEQVESATGESEHTAGPAPRPAPSVHFARPAEPAVVSAVPIADANVDLGVAPLTRRQARQQERIRTASVSVITPDAMAAHAAAAAGAVEQERADELAASGEPHPVSEPSWAPRPAGVAEPAEDPEHADTPEPAAEELSGDALPAASDDDRHDELVAEEYADGDSASAEPDAERPVLRPGFGSELLAGAEPVALPPSFDQLIARSATSTGAQSTSNALILSQAPSHSPIVGPVTATGEVLITGSMSLPEGLGSTGHAAGTADGKETDAVLFDREIPASSSPTPIAASAAISTVKGAQEIIRPPAPEKGSRLMLTLAITAGALALALVGVLILAFVTGALR